MLPIFPNNQNLSENRAQTQHLEDSKKYDITGDEVTEVTSFR